MESLAKLCVNANHTKPEVSGKILVDIETLSTSSLPVQRDFEVFWNFDSLVKKSIVIWYKHI